MISLRPSNSRGTFDHGWLKTQHSFSFGEYYDPKNMNFSVLRVINEDVVAPSTGFGLHPHKNMEIITLVLSGELEHGDSLGHREILRPGEIQRMSAGTGIRHSEQNPSPDTPVHLLQIWIEPRETGLAPRYDQRPYQAPDAEQGGFVTLVSGDEREGSLSIYQDAAIELGRVVSTRKLERSLDNTRKYWVQMFRGAALINGEKLSAGDSLAIVLEDRLEIQGEGEFLLFDLP